MTLKREEISSQNFQSKARKSIFIESSEFKPIERRCTNKWPYPKPYTYGGKISPPAALKSPALVPQRTAQH
ncbi:MAG: hypothetical protein V7K53_10845 [Nostoc sp.]